jgi:hypothetical protein
MKATVNIALGSVELEYMVSSKDMFPFSQDEINEIFREWEIFQKNKNSKVIVKY